MNKKNIDHLFRVRINGLPRALALGLLLVMLAGASRLPAQSPPQPDARQADRLAWWTDARFGMFIHWGLYALPARHEWVKKDERLTDEQYEKYFRLFNPDLYNPREWAKAAKAAGMRYAVLTTKHHEGFCLFDSQYTDYKATNTPAGRDLVREFVEAFRAEGLKVGFYYSLLDWHHPDYTIDRNHPQSPATDAEYDALNAGRDMNRYRQYVKDQVRELLTHYGKIDIIWLDYSFPSGTHGKGRQDWDSANLLRMVRELQPGIIVNDRLDLLDVEGGGDFTTPEQYKVSKWPEKNGVRVPWETCQTFSGSWGYYRDEYTWKDIRQLLGLLIETVSKGGNLLLNVGPTARGVFDDRAAERLREIGAWMRYNSRSIYGCTQAPPEFQAPANALLTYNPKTRRLYVHLLDYPMGSFRLPGYAPKVAYAQFLHDGSEIQFGAPRHNVTYQEDKPEEDLILELPMVKPNVEIPVIELILK
jgi:alpha-L-fucosidase